METFSLESVEAILLEQEAVSRTAWKEGIHEAEVSCSGHGVVLPSIWINWQPPVIAWHDNLWKQSLVLCTAGNNQAAAFICSSVVWILVCELKQGMAHAGTCAHPRRTGCCVEMVLVLRVLVIHSGVHQAIWRVDGNSHDTPIIGNKQGIRMHPTWILVLGMPVHHLFQVSFYGLHEKKDPILHVKTAFRTVHHQANVHMLDALVLFVREEYNEYSSGTAVCARHDALGLEAVVINQALQIGKR